MPVMEDAPSGKSFRHDCKAFMQCPACKAKLDQDSTYCHHCGRSLDKARRLDLYLDLGLTASFLALSWVTLLWLGF